MSKESIKANMSWIINVFGFFILLGGIIFAAGQNREKINNNTEYISKVENMNTIAHAGIAADISAIRSLQYEQNGLLKELIGEMKSAKQMDCK